MADNRPAIAQATADLARSHNARGHCEACDEAAPCEASLMLAEASDRLRRRLKRQPSRARK